MAGTTTDGVNPDAINPDGTDTAADTTADTAANTASEEPESAQADKPEATSLASIRQTLQSLWDKAKPAREAWGKRPKLPYTLYAVVMVLIDAAAVLFIQWGMYSEPTYADPNAVDNTTKILNSVKGQLTKFVSQMWLEHKYNFLLNFMVLGLIYLVLMFVLNRFWVATAVFGITMSVYAAANAIKVQVRDEPIIPSDLGFLTSGNGGEITSFIPDEYQQLVTGSVAALIWFTIVCLLVQCLDGRRGIIPCHWKEPSPNPKTIACNSTRIIAALCSITLLWSFTWNLGTNGSWSYRLAEKFDDSAILWSTKDDALHNGPAMSFLRLAHAKTMEKPEGYSKATMQQLAERYAANAGTTNQSRTGNLTDSTVIMILSESFSDPTRVPGVSFAEDPMPNIRAVKDTTTSGLMLSPAIGGGTANIEYQALTGLNLALFDNSMQSPYQELVPHQKQPYAFNQIWNDSYGESGSVAFHPFYKNMYLRDANYKKFGFEHLYTLDSNPSLTHQEQLDSSPYIDDAAAYQNVLDAVNGASHAQFIQLVTMQNHTPYSDWYADNQFKEADISDLSDDERYSIDTYAKGVNITDQTTADFLNQLNAIGKPITVIFYGDHLPGIYSTAAADADNTVTLHETDYFIWSNQASGSAGVKIDPAGSGYVSSNYFMTLAAQHMNVKVTPYLEFLSEMHAAVPAFNRLVGSNDSWGEGNAYYLDAAGNRVKRADLSDQAKQLLQDYELIQYDMTKGKNYLGDQGFFEG